ncbi:MAG: amidohydrolase family protein [Thaumarchaeota archaeon]|nr:amidohydrolase family protein [Nitrososphaerota archaeon]
MKLDVSTYPIIDHHCHPWAEDTREISKELYVSLMNMGGLSPEEAMDPENVIHSEFTPMGRQILHLMADFLGCKPRLSEVIEVRNKRAKKDYWEYCGELFDDAGIEGLFIDDGYSEVSVGAGLAKNDIHEFELKAPVPIRRVARIEPRFQTAVDESSSYEDFVTRFDRAIEDAVKKENVIAFKSVIAYRSGLHIDPATEEQVRKDYERSKATRARDVKHIRDWYVRRVIRKSRDLGTTFHIHAGMGDIDVVFDRSNPMQLYGLLKDPETWKTKIFLIHGGYPFSQEAAFYANALKNVYIDMSEMIPFASIPGATEKTMQILDMAPPARVVFGSDGVVIPEIHWAGAKIGRQVLEEVLGGFVKAKVYDEDEAYEAAKMILAGNAKRVYNPW